MDLSVIEQLSFSTVRIEATSVDGSLSTGTGFFYAIRLEGKDIPLVITNKHVVKDTQTAKLRFTLKNEAGEPDYNNHFDCQITEFKDAWTNHSDPDVDLCAMPMAEVVNLAVENSSIEPFYKSLDSSMIPSPSDIEELIGMEDVKMIGYPNGIWDEVNNLPVFRKGVLASNFKHDWNGNKEFIIDLPVFPGSSGSPVMLIDEQGFKTKKGINIGSTRIKLLGMAYAYFKHTVAGDVEIIEIPANQKTISLSDIPNNLGLAIKSERLLAFDDIFKQKLNDQL